MRESQHEYFGFLEARFEQKQDQQVGTRVRTGHRQELLAFAVEPDWVYSQHLLPLQPGKVIGECREFPADGFRSHTLFQCTNPALDIHRLDIAKCFPFDEEAELVYIAAKVGRRVFRVVPSF